MVDADELRAELAAVAASLRAYLEQQQGSGATGIPRGEVRVRSAPARQLAPPEVAEPRAPAASPEPLPAARPTAREVPAPRPSVEIGPSAESRRVAQPPAPRPRAVSTDRDVRLPQLAAEIASCTKCGLARTRTQTVFARGNPAASLCFIGEAPGADEDARGLPFVGKAGQLLDRMIEAMGLSPERDAYIVNILRCRPPGNRRPEPDEVAACLPYLHDQLELVKPKVIVALGNTAVATLLGTNLGITKLRGQWKLYRGTTLLMPTYHPSYLLRPSPQQADAKKQAWEDLQAVLRELGLPVPPPKKRAPAKNDEEPE